MHQEIVFGDVAATIIGRLNARLAATSDAARAHRRVPNPRPDRFVLVRRTGGPVTNLRVTERAQVTIEAWDVAADDAHDLAMIARAVTLALEGELVAGIQFYGIDEFSGPADLPDDDLSLQSRFSWTASLHCRAVSVVNV
jgi:hypothetical protein